MSAAAAATTAIGFVGKSHLSFHFRPNLIYCFRFTKVRRVSSVSGVECPPSKAKAKSKSNKANVPLFSNTTATTSTTNTSFDDYGRDSNRENEKISAKWQKLSSKELGISNSMIDHPTRLVLKVLKNKGYDVYLVGGCVRDLILNRIPKDFDIITTATLKQVQQSFSNCQIVGRRFPICHVHVADSTIEVSSFNTSARHSLKNVNSFFARPRCNDEDYMRWKNCVRRDFTINGLMFDPYSKTIYDYVGGIEDIKKSTVQTVIPATNSFTEDCARILRAVRIAARLEFAFTKEMARALKELSSSLLRLDKGRILMELNYMLAYGSAEASLRLLWKYGLLELLLPIQAAYFVSQGFRRRDRRSNLLLSLFANLDKLLAPDRPCHTSLWLCILAVHKALVDHPRDPMVIATFCLAVYNGGSLSEAIGIAESISQPYDKSFPELLEPRSNSRDHLRAEVRDLAESVKEAVSQMMDETVVSKAMAKYPQAPRSDLVFISLALQIRLNKIVNCVTRGREKGVEPTSTTEVDYESLAAGDLQEVRQLLSRIIFETIYPGHLKGS